MKKYDDRVIKIATFIVKYNATIRSTAKHFSMAKSTVHYDIQHRLPNCSKLLFEKVKKVLKNNFSEKHIRGGEATKNYYLNRKRR